MNEGWMDNYVARSLVMQERGRGVDVDYFSFNLVRRVVITGQARWEFFF